MSKALRNVPVSDPGPCWCCGGKHEIKEQLEASKPDPRILFGARKVNVQRNRSAIGTNAICLRLSVS